jgi:glutaredoxin
MITIYYLSYCPHSQNALKTLHQYNIDHHKIESSENKDDRKTYYPTFPQIYWNEHIIGGNSDFQNIIKTLQNCNIPNTQENWDKREWLNFLLYIAKKI